jgi:alpha-L-rhamnosidase
MNDRIITDFAKPSSEFRGAPFWAWNGKLDQEELRRQIRVMNKMGLGGFFMHSRVGLDTPYLSDEWFDCIKACIDEADKLNMRAWLYDEDRWPSGAAGGLVTSDPEYRARRMLIEEFSDLADFDTSIEAIALYLAEIDGDDIKNLRRIEEVPAQLVNGDTLLRFRVKIDECNPWYNSGTYLDTLNKKAVQKFIEVTHEAYRKEVSEHFAGVVPGIFTDEPNYTRVFDECEEGTNTVWTDSLPEVFQQRYGYDILEHLPEMVYNVEGADCKTRFNYLDCITSMFVDAFGRQTGEWCEKNNMLHTGHLLHEDTLGSQTFCIGSAMRFYEYMQAPGMDLLTEHWRIYDVAKQVSSVAHQFGRQWRLTETYGCTGWDFPFLGHKALGDWQVALGINLRCQHLSWYTMQGQAKRDYPASIFYQSSWWEQYGKVEDYFARINLVMNKGEEIRDLLYIHPIESSWTIFSRKYTNNDKLTALDTSFYQMRDCLLQSHLDFDFGDEDIMSRHGSVEMQDGIPVLRIAKAVYRSVVVPEMLTIRSSTLKLLQEFKTIGGQVVFGAAPAEMVDVEASDAAAQFAAGCVCFEGPCEELVKELETNCRRVSISRPSGAEIGETLYLLREDEDSACLFICNTGTVDLDPRGNPLARELTMEFSDVCVELKTAIRGKVIELDPETGEMSLAKVSLNGDAYVIETSLPALGSRLFTVVPDAVAANIASNVEYVTEQSTQLGDDSFQVALSEDNVLPLDRAEYQIEGQEPQDSNYILFIDQQVRDAVGMERRGGQMNQPWTGLNSTSDKTANVELKYTFHVEYQPSGSLKLGLECPELYDLIAINGNVIINDSVDGWWCDKSLKTLPVDPAFIKPGLNEITLKCCYDGQNPGFECIYLLGDFGTRADGLELSLTPPTAELELGDWGKQGLTFYSGSVLYKTSMDFVPEAGKRCVIKVPEFRAPCIRIMVNGEDAGNIAWAPFELDVTDFLKSGENQIIIEVFGSRRNSHGPLYQNETWPIWSGPGQFMEYTGEYKLVPCGLMALPEMIIRKEV